MSDPNLPVKKDESFLAEYETMDLSELKDKQFLVAVSREDRNGYKFVCSTTHGPYNFVEMVEEVGVMWKEHQHHAKVILCDKDRNKAIKSLDENTVDYIECHYTDIVTEAMLDGVFDEVKEYTCRAGINEAGAEEDPRAAQKALPAPKEDEEDDV